MSKEIKTTEKKSVAKKTFLDKCNTEIKKVKEEVNKLKTQVSKYSNEGLSSVYPLYNAIRTLRLKVMDEGKTSGTNNLKMFMETNFSPLKVKKLIFNEIGYPSEKDEQGKFKRDVIFANLFMRANKLSTVIEYDGNNGYEKNNCSLTLKGTQFYVVSNEIYPDVDVVGNKEIKSVKNTNTDLIKLTTRGLEIIWARCRPVITRDPKHQDDSDSLTKNIKQIKDWFNQEWLKRVRNVNYLDENYTKTDLDNLETIAQLTLRIVEQFKVDKANITKDGNINEIKTIRELVNVSYQVKNNENKLVSKAS